MNTRSASKAKPVKVKAEPKAKPAEVPLPSMFSRFPLFTLPAEDPLSEEEVEHDEEDFNDCDFIPAPDMHAVENLQVIVNEQNETIKMMMAKMNDTDNMVRALIQGMQNLDMRTKASKTIKKIVTVADEPIDAPVPVLVPAPVATAPVQAPQAPQTPVKDGAADMYYQTMNPINGTPITVNLNTVSADGNGNIYSSPDLTGMPPDEACKMVIGKTMTMVYRGPRGGLYYLTPTKNGTYTQKYLNTEQKMIAENAIRNSK